METVHHYRLWRFVRYRAEMIAEVHMTEDRAAAINARIRSAAGARGVNYPPSIWVKVQNG